ARNGFGSLSSMYWAISSRVRATVHLSICTMMPWMQARDRLIVALDASSRDEILSLVDELHGIAGTFKIGLQAFVSNGPAIVREIASRGERVFLDLKIHDIPNTAKHA